MGEGGVALDGHAQAEVDHAGIAILCAKCLVGHLEARRAVHGAVDPHDLETPWVLYVMHHMSLTLTLSLLPSLTLHMPRLSVNDKSCD